MTFEEELDNLFNNAISVKDTIWFSKHETLRDAILRIHEADVEQIEKHDYSEL